MDVSLILKVVGIGLLVSVATQVLGKSGRDVQSMLVTVTGILVVVALVIHKLGEVMDMISDLFGL